MGSGWGTVEERGAALRLRGFSVRGFYSD